MKRWGLLNNLSEIFPTAPISSFILSKMPKVIKCRSQIMARAWFHGQSRTKTQNLLTLCLDIATQQAMRKTTNTWVLLPDVVQIGSVALSSLSMAKNTSLMSMTAGKIIFMAASMVLRRRFGRQRSLMNL